MQQRRDIAAGVIPTPRRGECYAIPALPGTLARRHWHRSGDAGM